MDRMVLPGSTMIALIALSLGTASAVAQTSKSTGTSAPTPMSTGTSPPPAGCGKVCTPVPQATIVLEAHSATGGYLQGQPFAINYTITNITDHDISGNLHITFDDQPMLFGEAPISLQHGQSTHGLAIFQQPPPGVGVVDARLACTQFTKEPQHQPSPMATTCPSTGLLAEQSTNIQFDPDQDGDGLSDTIEGRLLSTYTPLLLFSKDHGSDEKWRPIDVLAYIHGSKLTSKITGVSGLGNQQLQDASAILGVTDAQGHNVGTLNNLQIAFQPPRKIYLAPNDAAQHGADWGTVLGSRNVGLYGHVVPIEVDDLAGEPAQGGTQLRDVLHRRYCPSQTVCRTILYKVEYYQFFGFSHDFEVTGTDQALGALATAGLGALVGIPLPPVDVQPIVKQLIDHDGDWCSVALLIDPAVAAPDKAILAVYHYAHGLQFRFYMDPDVVTSAPIASPPTTNNMRMQLVEFSGEHAAAAAPSFPVKDGVDTDAFLAAQNNRVQLARPDATSPLTHPVVYVEWGGHEFWPTAKWSLLFASKHNGEGYGYFAATPPNVGEVGSPMPNTPGAKQITGFSGFWGAYVDHTLNAPPEGPPLHRQWQYPASTQVSPSIRKGDAPF